MLPIVDANVILRYLLNDNKHQAQKARAAIDAGCESSVEIIAEVVYVLEGVYSVPRQQISEVLTNMLDMLYVARNDELVYALHLFAKSSFDFVDCLLIAENQINGREVITFDKKLAKLVE